ncbi:hypothetical protein ACT3R7_11810 [Halomonas sp. AOP43-A1-21]
MDTKIINWKERAEKAEQERDALAAHVEQYAAFVEYVRTSVKRNGEYAPLITQEMDELLRETPATSLTRRELLAKAEALTDMAEEIRCMHPEASIDDVSAHLSLAGGRLRSRAKEIEPYSALQHPTPADSASDKAVWPYPAPGEKRSIDGIEGGSK